MNSPPDAGAVAVVGQEGDAGLASLRYLSTSYSEHYVSRDSRRMRNLVASEWYQARWGEHVQERP